MTTSTGLAEAARQFLRRVVWRERDSVAPEPIVVVLGPRGAGKSTALTAVSRECGGTVVHAQLDFGDEQLDDPIAAVASVAFLLMRDWTNLRVKPTFHRLGLALLALNEPLDHDRRTAEEQIQQRITEYASRTRTGKAGRGGANLLFSVADVATAVNGISNEVSQITQQAKPVIGALVRGLAGLSLRKAKRWHSAVPEAEAATAVDWLIRLSTHDRGQALVHVIKALLADIDAFDRQHRAARGRCGCLVPADRAAAHDHAWVLLLDHAHTDVARRFLAGLVTARRERVDEAPDSRSGRDPLLVVSAASEWSSDWAAWCEPWYSGTQAAGRPTIPVWSKASRDGWLAHVAGAENPYWYPVWLDTPVDRRLLGSPGLTGTGARELVSRLAAGHPLAEIHLRAQIAELSAEREDAPSRVLIDTVDGEAPLWERTLRATPPDDLIPPSRPWAEIPVAVAFAAHLDGRARAGDDLSPAVFKDAARTLRGLRRHLWISTFSAPQSLLWGIGQDPTQPHPAALHPWLARCLMTGLAQESGSSGLWDELFTTAHTARTKPGVGDDLYRDLALGKFDDVVQNLVTQFDQIDHGAWVRLLDAATSAPRRRPEPIDEAYRRLIPEHQPGRGPIEVAVSNLTALLWLLRDPYTAAEARWHARVRGDFGRLISNSGRADISALEAAARRF